MTNATVKPIIGPLATDERESNGDDFAELLSVLADLAVRVRGQRERIDSLGDDTDGRIQLAADHLNSLEQHALALRSEAAQVHNELQHARLI